MGTEVFPATNEFGDCCLPVKSKQGSSGMSNPNQNPGQQNQNPGQKPGQQQGGGQKPGQQQQDPGRQGQNPNPGR
jgi:type VI secretion system secreted protein VgrG